MYRPLQYRPKTIGAALICLSVLVVANAGCTGSSEPQFVANLVNARLQERETGETITEAHRQEIANVLMAVFGTPDKPDDPFPGESASVLERAGFDVAKLKIAAGPVYSNEQGQDFGLYRRHCVHCHGVTGDGAGPTAPFLNPYPRDYRHGRFKFKSTFGAAKPTHDDLKRVLMWGVPGSSMPSFRLLPDNELDALIEYVKYLSVRGETERRLLEAYAAEGDFAGLESAEELAAQVAGSLPLTIEDGEAEEPDYENTVASLMYAWYSAKDQVITAADVPEIARPDASKEDHEKSVDLGRTLFYGKAANCFSCHGDSAQGDGQANDFNVRFEWRKKLIGTPQPELDELVAEFRHDGALKPRNARPRNLRQGIFRGGRRPIDIYYRIYSGIYGTPMPGLGGSADASEVEDDDASDESGEEEGAKKVSPEDIWHIVNYVKSLQHEPFSVPTRYPVMSASSVETDHGR